MRTVIHLFLFQFGAPYKHKWGIITMILFFYLGTGLTMTSAANTVEAIPGLAGGIIRTHHVSGDGSKVVFASAGNPTGQNADGNVEIFIYDTTTKHIEQLTFTASQPNFLDNDGALPNYDATRIVLRSRFNLAGSGGVLPGRDLFLASINYAGASPAISFRRLTTTNENGPYSYSGNGQYVAFASDHDIVGRNPQRAIQIFRINLDPAPTIQQLTNEDDGIAATFLWMEVDVNYPGDRIVFTTTKNLRDRNPEANQEIYYVTDTGWIGQVTKTPAGVYNRHPRIEHRSQVAFSSNGDIVGSNPDGNYEIFLASEDYAAAYQITNSQGGDDNFGGANDQVDVSDDSRRIVFTSNRDLVPGTNTDGNREIFLANIQYNPFQVTFEQLTTTLNPHPGTRIENVYAKIDHQATRIAFNSDLSPDGVPGILFLITRSTTPPTSPPVITSFVPEYGGPGVPVEIYGSRFTGTTAVEFGSIPASSYQILSDSRIVAFAPPNVGESAIKITTPAGSVTSSTLFKLEQLVVTGTELSQGMATYPGVAGKDALVRAFVNVQHGGAVAITDAKLTVTSPSGQTATAEPRMYSMLIRNRRLDFSEANNINFSVPGGFLAESGRYSFRIQAMSSGQTVVDQSFTRDLVKTKDVVIILQSVMRDPNEVEWDTIFKNLEQFSRLHPVRAGIGSIRMADDPPSSVGLRVGYVIPPMFSNSGGGGTLPAEGCWHAILNQLNEVRVAFNALEYYEPIEFASAVMPRDSLISSACEVKDCAHLNEVRAFGYGNYPGHASWISLCGQANTTLAHEVAHNIGLVPEGAANCNYGESVNSSIQGKQAFNMNRWESVPDIMAAMCTPACGPDDIVFFEDTYNGQPVDYPWLVDKRVEGAGGSSSLPLIRLAQRTAPGAVHSDASEMMMAPAARTGRRIMVTARIDRNGTFKEGAVSALSSGKYLTAAATHGPVELILRAEDKKVIRREYLPIIVGGPPMVERKAAADFGTVAAVRPLPENTRSVEIAYNEQIVYRLQPGPNQPALRLQPIKIAKDRKGKARKLVLAWTGSDLDKDVLHYRVDFSRDGKHYQPLVVRTAATEVALPIATLPGGKKTRLRVTASDGLNSVDKTTAPFELPEHAPVAAITSLSDGERFREYDAIELRGLAFDLEDGFIGTEKKNRDRFLWILDGKKVVGIGPRILLDKKVRPGRHTISLEVKDSTGRKATAHRQILIEYDSDRDGRPDLFEYRRSRSNPFNPYDEDIEKFNYREWRNIYIRKE